MPFLLSRERLERKSEYYQSTYGVQPEFKAGVNGGSVIVTEVGKYKKEIAYYGDVLNVAARIQSKCNELGKDLLISGSLKERLASRESGDDLRLADMGELDLKGKETGVRVWAVFVA